MDALFDWTCAQKPKHAITIIIINDHVGVHRPEIILTCLPDFLHLEFFVENTLVSWSFLLLCLLRNG